MLKFTIESHWRDEVTVLIKDMRQFFLLFLYIWRVMNFFI